jgi:hypothetical protein
LFRQGEGRVAVWQWSTPNVFAALHDILNRDLFTLLRKITDPAKDGKDRNLVFDTLIEGLKLPADSPALKEMQNQVEVVRQHARHIRKYATKNVVHADAKVRLKKPLPPVASAAIQRTIDAAKDLMSLIAKAKGFERIHFPIDTAKDVDRMHLFLERGCDWASNNHAAFVQELARVRNVKRPQAVTD